MTSKERYYNPKLGLGGNSGKDLRETKKNEQLIKYKDTRLYLLLYILIDYKK